MRYPSAILLHNPAAVSRDDLEMSKRHPADGKKHAAAPRKSKRAALWVLAVLAVIAVGVAVKTASQNSPSRTAKPAAGAAKPVALDATLPDAEKDRALRREQLEASEGLLSQFPTNDDVAYLAGLVHEDQGNTEQAMKLWARSIELDATRGDANESLGQALLLRDDYTNAAKYFRRALALDTNSPSVRFRLATALSHQGRIEEALSVLEQSRGFSAEGYRLVAELCQQLKQYERARTNYEAAIRAKPEFPEAYYGLAQTLARLGDAEKGREFMEKSVALRRQTEEQARRVRADFDALAVTRKSVARTHTDVGRVSILLGNAQKAEELWRRAAELDPQNVLCRLQLAVLCQQTKRHAEALRFYEEAAKLDPRDGLTFLNMGRVCLKLSQTDRAERAFKEVIRLEPKRPEGYAALTQLYLQAQREIPEAERLARVAAELAPEAQYFALLAQACAVNGNPGAAVAAMNRAVDLQPGNAQFVQMRETFRAMQR